MWVNVKRAETARGAFVGGQQMYVEYMIPAQVRHPFPVVLVHGGGGQGTDWMGTPDGRPGWFQYLVQEGYKVYVVDRPGTGARRCTPTCTVRFRRRRWCSRAWRADSRRQARTRISSRTQYQKNHTQWPGPGNVGSPDLDQLCAGRAAATSLRRRLLARPRGARQGGPGGAAGPGGAGRGAAGRAAASGQHGARPEQRAAPGLASGRRGSARQDRPGDHHDALGRRPVRAAGGRSAARTW